MSKVKEGFLTKGGTGKPWVRHWIVLTKNELLMTMSQEDYEVVGRIIRKEIVKVQKGSSAVKPHCFDLEAINPLGGPPVRMTFAADSAQELQSWLSVLTLDSRPPRPTSQIPSLPPQGLFPYSGPKVAPTVARRAVNNNNSNSNPYAGTPAPPPALKGAEREPPQVVQRVGPAINGFASKAQLVAPAVKPGATASPKSAAAGGAARPAPKPQVPIIQFQQQQISEVVDEVVVEEEPQPQLSFQRQRQLLQQQQQQRQQQQQQQWQQQQQQQQQQQAPIKPPVVQRQASKPIIYIALYDYEGLTAEELNLSVGQEINFLCLNGEWIEAEIETPYGMKRGWVPANYVERLENPTPVVVPPPLTKTPSQPLMAKAQTYQTYQPSQQQQQQTTRPKGKYFELLRYEKRKDNVTKESFYVFVMRTEYPQSTQVYRRLSEFRALYVRLVERFPKKSFVEIPVQKDNLFTSYSSLLLLFYNFLDCLTEDVVHSDLIVDFFRETLLDKSMKSTVHQVVAFEDLVPPPRKKGAVFVDTSAMTVGPPHLSPR